MPPRAQSASSEPKPKKKRGRKPGSKNKGPTKKRKIGTNDDTLLEFIQPKPQGKRGRKPSAKNKAPSKIKRSGKKEKGPAVKAKCQPKKYKKKSNRNRIYTYDEKFFGKLIPDVSLKSAIKMQNYLEVKLSKLSYIYREMAGKNKPKKMIKMQKYLGARFGKQSYVYREMTGMYKQKKPYFPPLVPKPTIFQTANPLRPAFWEYIDELDLLQFDLSGTVSEPLINVIFRKYQERRRKHAYNVIIEERKKEIYDPEAQPALETQKNEENLVPVEPEVVKPVKKPKRRPRLFGKRRKTAVQKKK